MKSILLTSALVLLTSAASAILSAPANATLQLSIGSGGSTFTCSDGELSCDLSGAAKNLLTVDTTVGGAFVQLTLTQSTFGAHNSLQLSSSNIEDTLGVPITVTLLASDTGFTAPVSFVRNSGSLTFNSNVGAPDSTLSFFADTLNRQGANPANTPGSLLESVSGAAATDPDSFSGSKLAAFDASAPFSMTEGAALALRSDGSVTGFNQSMETGVPEASTWAMLIVGFRLACLGGSDASPGARAAYCSLTCSSMALCAAHRPGPREAQIAATAITIDFKPAPRRSQRLGDAHDLLVDLPRVDARLDDDLVAGVAAAPGLGDRRRVVADPLVGQAAEAAVGVRLLGHHSFLMRALSPVTMTIGPTR